MAKMRPGSAAEAPTWTTKKFPSRSFAIPPGGRVAIFNYPRDMLPLPTGKGLLGSSPQVSRESAKGLPAWMSTGKLSRVLSRGSLVPERAPGYAPPIGQGHIRRYAMVAGWSQATSNLWLVGSLSVSAH
jgi:hypothetical protein